MQIHNAHGYLLSNFLNPEENLRTDEYGGSLANRFRLIERILRAVRAACGTEFPMIVKADSNGCYTIYRKRFVRCVQHTEEIERFQMIPW